jgi:hypothetical protein
MNRTRTLAAALAACAVLAAPALAATKNGITPLSPKPGATVAAGKAAVFKARVRGKGTVWVHVCKSSRKDRKGVICHEEFIGQAKKRAGIFRATQKFFDFPDFWLNNPGTYYWQAHRIDCSKGIKDCLQEGPVVKFRVG